MSWVNLILGQPKAKVFNGTLVKHGYGEQKPSGYVVYDYLEFDDGKKYGKVSIPKELNELLKLNEHVELSALTYTKNNHRVQSMKTSNGDVKVEDAIKSSFVSEFVLSVAMTVCIFMLVGNLGSVMGLFDAVSIETELFLFGCVLAFPFIRTFRMMRRILKSGSHFGKSTFIIE